MKTRLMIGLAIALLWMTACSSPATAPVIPTTIPTTIPTQPPSVLPTPPESPVQPTGGLSTRPETNAWNNAPAAALSARGDLVGRVKVDPDTNTLVSVEKVEWPDGCLGVQTPGMMCTMVVTPGYRVILEVDGKQYEYHTNETGDVVRLANPT